MGCGCCGCGTNRGRKGSGWTIAMSTIVASVGVSVAVMGAGHKQQKEGKQPAATAPAAPQEAKSVYDFTMKRIDGKDESLGAYKGKVMLIVNVASECGLTPQYEGLQKLYKEKKDAGLVVLGFPANDFHGQEPGSNGDIATFCTGKYGVTFPMYEKITVVGKDAHPLYKFLSTRPAPVGVEPDWNFTKFLVGRDGNVAARFGPKMKPDDPEILKKVDELLAVKAGTQKGDGIKPGK